MQRSTAKRWESAVAAATWTFLVDDHNNCSCAFQKTLAQRPGWRKGKKMLTDKKDFLTSGFVSATKLHQYHIKVKGTMMNLLQ